MYIIHLIHYYFSPLLYYSVCFTHTMKRVNYQQRRRRRRQRRPRSAGPFRRRRSRSESNLRNSNNNDKNLPTWAVNNKHYNSNEPMALHHRTGAQLKRPLSKKEKQALEGGWDSKFAQNTVNNKYILSNRPQKHVIVTQGEINNNNGSKQQKEERVVFNGSPTKSKRKLRRPRSAGQLRRYRSNKMDGLATRAERKKLKSRFYKKQKGSNNNVKKKKRRNKYVVHQEQIITSSNKKYPAQLSQHEYGFGLDYSNDNINDTSYEDDMSYYGTAMPTVQLPKDAIFRKNCNTIRALWDELHVPNRDRRYFSRTFMLEYTDHNDKFVNEQLELLLAHREETIRTLIAIRERESAIKDLDSICKAAASALVRSNVIITTKKKKVKAPVPPPNVRPPVINLTTSIKKRNEEINNNNVNDLDTSTDLNNGNGHNDMKDQLQSLQIKSFKKLIIDRSRHAQLKTIEVIHAIKSWRTNLWRQQPFRWRNCNYILRVGNCVGLQDIVKQDEIAEAIRLCSIVSKDFILLLPPHIRKILFIDENNNDGADADDEGGEDIHNENDEGGKEEKTSVVNEYDTMDRKKLNIKDLMIDEEYIRNEQRTQIELRKELNDLLQAGYYIPTLKWNPNKLTFNMDESKE